MLVAARGFSLCHAPSAAVILTFPPSTTRVPPQRTPAVMSEDEDELELGLAPNKELLL
jgi:hypothetical protein